MTRSDPYNPLDLEALGESLLRHLERQPPDPLTGVASFVGSGIYALYYRGDAEPYGSLGRYNLEQNCVLPIYVGRAKGPGARRGISPLEPVRQPLLWQRIQEHRRSISNVVNLNAEHFMVRALVVMPIWVPLAEAMAIRQYRPVWNVRVAGFGIHAPGGGRQQQQISEWDELHPGRSFARALRQRQSAVPASRLAQLKVGIDADVAEARKRRLLEIPRQSELPPEPVRRAPRSRSASSPPPRRR